jgi:methyl-accepting chemotaxis protein
MDAVTQQNAALVEEAAAASQSMQDQAAALAQLVSVFQLARDGAMHQKGGLHAVASQSRAVVLGSAEAGIQRRA